MWYIVGSVEDWLYSTGAYVDKCGGIEGVDCFVDFVI